MFLLETTELYTEEYLLARVAEGDENAFSQLYNKYQPLLATHIFRLTQSKQLTEEFSQDVFMKIWQNRELVREVKNFKAYLGVVSKNHAINGLKKIARENAHRQKLVKETIEEDIKRIHERGGEEEFNIYGLLDEAIDQLPPQQKKVYLLARHERNSYAEISEKIGITPGTVKRYLQIATESVTKYLLSQMPSDRAGLLLLIALFCFE